MPDSTRPTLKPRTVLQALAYLQAETRQNVESNHISALLLLKVAGSNGMSIGELADSLDLSHVSASRMARVMSAYGLARNKAEGWGLVELGYDPTRPRMTIVTLNSKGVKVVNNFLSMLSPT